MDSISNYLVVLKLGTYDIERLRETVPSLEAQLSKISTKKPQLALRSTNADLCAYLIRTAKQSKQIRAEIESPGNWMKGGKPFLSGDDEMIIISLGDDFTASHGFTQVQTWLQLAQSA